MSLPAEQTASYDDLLALPENLLGETLCGTLHAHPRPAPRHALAASAIGYLVGGPFGGGIGGPGGWWIIDEPELHLGTDILVPDIAGWRRERLPRLPETAWFESAPDWVCEVLSPATARTDRVIKMPLYARHGVSHLWLVDPAARTLEVYRRQEHRRWQLLDTLKDAERVAQPPFESLAFSLAALWA